ncbi:MAG: phosphatidate cytidylyltransferase [Oscillospiraceae bacterium]|jgi:phosphatidate cytidylyltransferase|nr:phosphatidate cytidylyltransferase [Oscillospiraceae bacterium]
MKTRIITGLAYTALAAGTLFLLQSPLLQCLIIAFSAMAAYELCHAAQIKNKAMIAVSMACAALLPPLLEYWPILRERLRVPAYPLLLGYFLLLLALMLARFEITRFSHVLFALFASLAAPAAMATIVLMRDSIQAREGAAYEPNLAVWLIFFTLCAAWLTDAFAYFVGRKLGKHKLAPKISPKKTVEGAIGGLLGATLANLGFAALFNQWALAHYRINLPAVALLSLGLGAVAMVGDLAASVLKRNYGVKDFGRFFPGHGGVMDRFDSILLVSPVVYALLQLEQGLGLHIFYEVLQ